MIRLFDSVVQNEVAANSGAYNYGYAHIEKELLGAHPIYAHPS